MKKLFSLVSLLGIFALTGAGCIPLKETIPHDFSVQYTVGGCYGTCPNYSLKIVANGTGTYEGHAYVETKGTQPISISQREVKKLLQEVEAINFFSLQNEYIRDQTGDAGRRSIQVIENGKTKTITYDSGTAELNELAKLIENTTKVQNLVSATIDPTICVQRYGELKKQYDACKTDLGEAGQGSPSQQQKDELSQKREDLWKRIASSSNNDKRWMGVVMMATNIFYAEQWDQTFVVEKKKSPSGKQTLVVFGQKYDPSSLPIQRGFYILNEAGELVGSYIVPGVWEHFSIDGVKWKNEQTISYDYDLATEGDAVTPPEKHEYFISR